MKKTILIFLLTIVSYNATAQAIYKTINSSILGKERELKILLPRGYSDDDKKAYPVIYVFDGDYLFEAVAGNVDYMAYWEDIPDAIVVGINQSDSRANDMQYSNQNGLPIDDGASFFDFVGQELIPYVKQNFKTVNFSMAVGHGETANFINYFLIRENPVFKAYITISPDMPKTMIEYVTDRLKTIDTKIFYYLATSKNDVPHIRTTALTISGRLKYTNNENLLYTFDNHDKATHYSLPTHIIPNALDKIFFPFRPITKKEFNESIMSLSSSPVEYLQQKYQEIQELFGFKKQIAITDFKAIEAAIKRKQEWNYLEDLAKLARKEYPETILPSYYLAMFYEKTDKKDKAIKIYMDSYILDEVGGITKNYMLDKANELKAGK